MKNNICNLPVLDKLYIIKYFSELHSSLARKMKVIVAGFPKTGTKTMNAALTKMGYKVYDVMENVYFLHEEWGKIFEYGWTSEDFKRMYDGIDAIVDIPACYFWEEIHKAFPDAKIILTVRDNEDVWYRSWKKHFDLQLTNIPYRLLNVFSPTQRKVNNKVSYKIGSVIFGLSPPSFLEMVLPFRSKFNEALLKLKYRAHNAYVLQNAPSDKLLVYNCSEGWEPLCTFLGSSIPDESFPHINVGGSIVDELILKDPIFKKMQKEMLISFTLVVAVLTVGGYCAYKGPSHVPRSFINLVHVICSTLKFTS